MAARWMKRIAVVSVVTGGVVFVGWKGLHLILPDKSTAAVCGSELDSRKQDHYVRIQKNCLTAVHNLMPPLKEVMISCLSTESITLQLKETNDQAVKISLWEDLKVISFSRAVLSACVSSVLVLLVRLQFSIVAAYLFSDGESITEDIQRQYLSTIHQSLQKGLEVLAQRIKSVATETLLQYSLKHTMTVEIIKQIVLQILDKSSSVVHTASSDGVSPWLLSFLLQDDPLVSINGTLNQLLTATLDTLEIKDTHDILDELVEKAVVRETCIVTEAFHSAAQSSTSLPLAKVIPIVSDSAVFLLHSQNTSFLQEMTNKDELMTLSRNCYEAFSQ